jgi:seryl-tRNA synthetase
MAKNLFNEILGEDSPKMDTSKKKNKLSKKERKKLKKKIEKKMAKKLKKGSKKERKLLLEEFHNLEQEMAFHNKRTDEILWTLFQFLSKQPQQPKEMIIHQAPPLLALRGDRDE